MRTGIGKGLKWGTARGYLVIAALAVPFSGCALKQPKAPVNTSSAGELGKPIARFPSKEELRSRQPIANPASANANPIPTMPVDRWEIKTAIPAPGASYGSESRWDKLLMEALASRSVTPSPALRCAAEEAARFFVANAAYPDEQLQQYLVARCGSSLVLATYGTLHTQATGAVTEDRILSEMGGDIRKLIDQVIATSPNEVGLGYAQGSGRISFVMFAGRKTGSFNELSPEVQSNRVYVSGTLTSNTAFAIGLVTHGTDGFRHCEPDRGVSAPRFKISCPVAEGDSQARIEVAGRRTDEILWEVGLRLLVRRDASAGLVYQPHREGVPNAAPASGDYAQSLSSAINDVRRRARLGDLQLVVEQTKANQELSGYLYDAIAANDSEHAQWAALGMLAGWEVPGVIRDGGIYWLIQAHGANPQGWVDAAMESPFGRWVLLDTNKMRIAVGAHPTGKAGMLTLVTTYGLFDSQDHHQDEDALFNELTELRRAKGLGDPERVARSQALTEALAKIANNSRRPDEATAELMQAINVNARRPASAQVIESTSLSQFVAPESLFKEHISIEIGITHYKAAGGAWGQYVFLMVLRDTGDSRRQVARATR